MHYIKNKHWERFGIPNLHEVFHCPTPLEIVEGKPPGHPAWANVYKEKTKAVEDALIFYRLEIAASELRASEFRKLLDGEIAYQERVKAWAEALVSAEGLEE